jgi:hypothetical protein
MQNFASFNADLNKTLNTLMKSPPNNATMMEKTDTASISKGMSDIFFMLN